MSLPFPIMSLALNISRLKGQPVFGLRQALAICLLLALCAVILMGIIVAASRVAFLASMASLALAAALVIRSRTLPAGAGPAIGLIVLGIDVTRSHRRMVFRAGSCRTTLM